MAYIHFEDFGLSNARRILEKYRPHIACFNDDVQGTGCVTLAAIMATLHVTKLTMHDLRIVMFGAGTAGTGIADQIRDAIALESEKSKDEAIKHIWYVASKPCSRLKCNGLLLERDSDCFISCYPSKYFAISHPITIAYDLSGVSIRSDSS
jgi:malate dehydrogenase (oxaloacetate-decarboxylating)